MADNNTTQSTDLNTGYVYENRRYVGRKETVGFVLWDAAQSFNIDKYTDRFITNIVQVDLSLQMIEQAINGVWDIVNDIFMGAIVDRTRTRWGKFKPYLLLLAVPGLIGTCLYWLMPIIFTGRTSMDLTKFIFYFLLAFVREGIGTFQTISRNGMMATITPHPVDRTRLITLANFASGTFGEKLPEQITTVILDLIDNSVFKTKKSTLYLTTFVGMGVFTTIISSGMSMWYFLNSKERVMQSVEKPDIMQGVKSIINNKPILLLTLSDFLGGFSIGGSKSDYYIDVLHLASMTMITGIAAVPVSPVSYAYVPFLRRRFSSRFLYISSNYISTFLDVIVFFVGCVGMNWKTKKGGIYQSTIGMLVVMSVYELVWTLFYGTKSVIGTEMYNESMDYCEWKNGYRTEAMTSVAKDIAKKVSSKVSSLVRTWLKNLIKYDQSAYVSGREQTDSVKFYLFAMFTIIPAVTGFFGIIPMLFYDLDGKKKELMYAELLERRAALQEAAGDGDSEALAAASKEQLEKIEKK